MMCGLLRTRVALGNAPQAAEMARLFTQKLLPALVLMKAVVGELLLLVVEFVGVVLQLIRPVASIIVPYVDLPPQQLERNNVHLSYGISTHMVYLAGYHKRRSNYSSQSFDPIRPSTMGGMRIEDSQVAVEQEMGMRRAAENVSQRSVETKTNLQAC